MLSASRLLGREVTHRISSNAIESLRYGGPSARRYLHASSILLSGSDGGGSSAQPKYSKLSNKAKIVHRNLLRKMKQGLDRLPSQGPDPAAEYKHGWRLATAAVLERYPLVIPEPSEFEATYQRERFLYVQAMQRPMGADWFLSEKDKLEGREPQVDDPRAEMYQPAPRVTEDDRTGDIRSMNRALDERLYLIVRRTQNAKYWQFPQVLATDPQVPMREYTNRALNGVLPRGAANRPKVHHLSYIPSAHLEHVFPLEYQRKHDVYGVKIFFYRIMLMSGKVTQIENNADFAWATIDQLKDMLSPAYHQAVKPILLEVGPH